MTTYVAGPMTGLPACNYPAFHRAVKALAAVGVDATSAAHDEHGAELQPPTPVEAEPYDYYVRFALRRLLDCDQLVTLAGWKDSRAALLEVEVAHTLGIPVYDLGELIEGAS